MVLFLGEYAAYSIADAFSKVFHGVCEAAQGSPAFIGAVTAAFAFLYFRLVAARLVCRCSGGLHGCLRICGACGYGDRHHSTVLCRK